MPFVRQADEAIPIGAILRTQPNGKVVNAYEIDDAEGHATRALRDLG